MIPHHLIVDRPTLLALGGGNRSASALVHQAYLDPTVKLWVPVLCVLQADRERRGVATHVGSLQVLNSVCLEFSDMLAVAELCGEGLEPSTAHAVQAARPALERPDGAIIATVDPGAYHGTGGRVMDLDK